MAPPACGAVPSSPRGREAVPISGTLGPIPPDRRADLAALGVPSGARVGASGLERIFDVRLLGRPGGDLRAGGRLLAHAEPRPAPPVRTTISTKGQAAAGGAPGARPRRVPLPRPR